MVSECNLCKCVKKGDFIFLVTREQFPSGGTELPACASGTVVSISPDCRFITIRTDDGRLVFLCCDEIATIAKFPPLL